MGIGRSKEKRTRVVPSFKADNDALNILSRSLSHLPSPGWRDYAAATPPQLWNGLQLEEEKLWSKMRIFVLSRGLIWPSKRQRVISISLPASDVMGRLPSSFEGAGKRKKKNDQWALASLRHLVLYSNSISGPIPLILGLKLRRLESLNLGGNRLTNREKNRGIPETLGLLKELQLLDLHSNLLSGNLDEQCNAMKLRGLTKLIIVSFGENEFHGPFPREMTRMKFLREIYLRSLRLHGTLPDFRGNWALEVLDISDNKFKGPIPRMEGSPNLCDLRFQRNNFTGELPETLGCLRSLTRLDVSHNNLSGINCVNWGLSGGNKEVSDGEWSGNLTTLTHLDCSNNNINGSLSHGLGDLRNLKVLNISKNHICGRVPGELLALRNLVILDLSRNEKLALQNETREWLSSSLPKTTTVLI